MRQQKLPGILAKITINVTLLTIKPTDQKVSHGNYLAAELRDEHSLPTSKFHNDIIYYQERPEDIKISRIWHEHRQNINILNQRTNSGTILIYCFY